MKNSAGFVPNKPKEVLVHGPFPPLWSEARPTKLGGGFTPLEITEISNTSNAINMQNKQIRDRKYAMQRSSRPDDLPRHNGRGGSLTGFAERGPFGFTILELLVIITVILVLTTITVVALGSLGEKGNVTATEGLIKSIEIALTNYKEVFPEYPPSDQGTWKGSQNLYHYLTKKLEYHMFFDPVLGTSEKKEFHAGLRFKKQYLDHEKYVIDPWGNRLTYKNPGTNHRSSGGKNNSSYVDIESNGPSAAPDDNINNWSLNK